MSDFDIRDHLPPDVCVDCGMPLPGRHEMDYTHGCDVDEVRRRAEAPLLAEVERLRALVERAKVLVTFAYDVPSRFDDAVAWMKDADRSTSPQRGGSDG